LVFNFLDENLSPANRRGGDGGFDVVYFLEADVVYCGGTVWWAVGGLIGAWTEKKIET
jgi:hypothetical protein